MSSNQSSAINILIIAAVLFGIIIIVFSLKAAFGQTVTTTPAVQEVQQQVAQNSAQIDTTTAVAGVTGIGTIGTFLTWYMNERKKSKEAELKNAALEESDKRTDRDNGLSQLYFYRLIQTMDAMIPEVAKCLDQPFSADPMQKHITIRMKLSEDANATADYLKTTLNTSVPSMTPAATVIVADAKQQLQNPPVQLPPAPVNNNTENKQG